MTTSGKTNLDRLFRPMTFIEIIARLPPHILEQLNNLKNLREREDFHPEENTFEHIRIVTERLIPIGDPDLICTAIFHDIFKLLCVKTNEKTGKPTSPGHDKFAAELLIQDESVREFCKSLGANPDNVAWLCLQHMRVKGIDEMKQSKQDDLRNSILFHKLETFTRADNMLKDFTV
jgi:hypothetical protein